MEVMDLKKRDLVDDFRLKKMADGMNIESLMYTYLSELQQIKKFDIVETTEKQNKYYSEIRDREEDLRAENVERLRNENFER